QTDEPGVYLFDFTLRDGGGRKETYAFVVNVDTANESPLQRASRDDLEKAQTAPGSIIIPEFGAPITEELSSRQRDLSESPWLYLIFLVVLVFEQALAVHLSFHLRGSEAALPAQAVKPQATAA